MVQQVVNQSTMLCFTLPSAKTLLHDAFGFRHPFLRLLSKNTDFISLQNQQNSCWTPPANLNTYAYLVSQRFMPEHSIQPKKLFNCVVVLG